MCPYGCVPMGVSLQVCPWVCPVFGVPVLESFKVVRTHRKKRVCPWVCPFFGASPNKNKEGDEMNNTHSNRRGLLHRRTFRPAKPFPFLPPPTC